MKEEQLELHAVVYGYVQGVGFRASTRHYAQQLKLKGTVKNLENGSVEIYAQGSKKNLEELLENIKTISRIEQIQTNFYPIKNSYNNFAILF